MTVNQQLKSDKRFIIFLVIISAIVNVTFLEYNNYLIRQSNPANIERNARSLVNDQTIFSVDNEYYVSPVENYLSGKGWKRGHAVSNGDYFRRVPGYSIVYLFFTGIFKEPAAHLFLKVFQVLLFLSTIPAIYYLCKQVSGRFASRLVTIIYSLIPFISSWAYYTLTESISPALAIFYLYYLVRAWNAAETGKKTKFYFLSSMFLTFAILTRPYIAIAGLALFICAFRDFIFYLKGNWLRFFYATCLIPALLIGAWTIRNYSLTKEFVPLEKAFYPQSIDRMKPEFRGLFSFVKCWGEDGFNLTAYHEPMYWAAVKGDTNSRYVTHILNSWPREVINKYKYDTLFSTLRQHQQLIFSFRSHIATRTAMPDQYLPAQLAMEKKYDHLIAQYKKEHFVKYWIITPLIYLKRMVAHSHTANLYFFQDKNRDKQYVNLYRYLLLLIHISFYVMLVLNLFLMKGWRNRLVFVYVPLLFIIFFTFMHREIEQRYMLPVLPILIAGSASGVERVLQLFSNRMRQKLRLSTND